MKIRRLIIAFSMLFLFTVTFSAMNMSVNANTESSPVMNLNNIQNFSANNQTGLTGNITSETLASGQSVAIGDGQVSSFWSSVPKLDVAEYSSVSDGVQGYVQSTHDSYYIYFLFAFDSKLTWIAAELNTQPGTQCMDAGSDGWVFGNNTASGIPWVGDVHFTGQTQPTQDVQNDVSFERIVDKSTGVTFIEMKRALDTGDTAGMDVTFKLNTMYYIRFASNEAHKTGERTIYSLAISSNVVPVGSSQTTSTTSSVPIEVVKGDHLNTILVWGSVAFFFNVILVNLLIIYHRRF